MIDDVGISHKYKGRGGNIISADCMARKLSMLIFNKMYHCYKKDKLLYAMRANGYYHELIERLTKKGTQKRERKESLNGLYQNLTNESWKKDYVTMLKQSNLFGEDFQK